MRIPRVFHSTKLHGETLVELDSNAANHVARVLRLSRGAAVILFDGEGGEYDAVLESLDKRRVVARVGAHYLRDRDPPLELWLAQGISRGERMDYTVQKAVELGVSRIVPLFTERCGVQLVGERLEKRVQHWHAVAVSACEQCGRNRLPDIDSPRALREWLTTPPPALGLVLDPEADATLGTLTTPQGAIALLIGPEGGLSDAEIELAKQRGYLGLRLGPRILRTETAALAALSALLARWGDFA